MRVSGFSIFKLLRYLREELMVVFATTSSDSVLPQIMSKLKRMGIRDSTVGLVIPTGYSFNLDAFSIYITLAAVFIAQATNTPISMTDLLTILASRWSPPRAPTACPARRSWCWRPRCRRFRRSPRSAWCWCCRSTGSWASPARWAT